MSVAQGNSEYFSSFCFWKSAQISHLILCMFEILQEILLAGFWFVSQTGEKIFPLFLPPKGLLQPKTLHSKMSLMT